MAIYPRVIYKITHTVTNRCYIGSTADFECRMKNHFNALKAHRHPVADMQQDFDKFGNHFSIEIIGEMQSISEFQKEYDAMEECLSFIRGLGYNYKDNHKRWESVDVMYLNSVYPNVRAEFARNRLTLQQVSQQMNMRLATLSIKLKNGTITVSEAKSLKKILKTDMSLEELFEEAQ